MLLAACIATAALAQRAAEDFVWIESGPEHSTHDIRALDPAASFACLETANFKIACTLAPMKLPSSAAERRRIDDDLKAAAAKGIAGVRGRARLDTRDRAHLYGVRLERLYAEVQAMLGVTDADFPTARPAERGAGYAGEGPFLGMPRRFTVLLVEHESTLAHYVQAWCNRTCWPAGTRHFFQSAGSMFLGICAEGNEGRFRDDRILHAALVYSAVHNLLDAFRYYWHETPFWLQEGAAHWFRRRVLEDLDVFTRIPADLPERNRQVDWPATAAARARLGNFTPLREMLTWIADRPIRYGDHVAMWSRIDFLMQRHPGALGRILRATKYPQPSDQPATPSDAVLVDRQVAALRDVLGLDPDGFDGAWVAFTKEAYR